jgi:hypothetical protein
MVIVIFFQMKSKEEQEEQEKYFQQLSNSFEEAALICNAKGKLFFSNNAFKNAYGSKIITIEEFLDIADIEKMPLGTDITFNKDNGEKHGLVIYKMMNRTKNYQEELFIVIMKES